MPVRQIQNPKNDVDAIRAQNLDRLFNVFVIPREINYRTQIVPDLLDKPLKGHGTHPSHCTVRVTSSRIKHPSKSVGSALSEITIKSRDYCLNLDDSQKSLLKLCFFRFHLSS